MMKTPALLLVSALAIASAAPQFPFGPPEPTNSPTTTTTTPRPINYIPVLSRNEVRDDDGQIVLNYRSADGTNLDQVSVLKPSQDPKKPKVIIQQGSYSYISPDGTPVQVSYIADERGFRPVGTHILGAVPVVPDLAPFVPAPVQPVPAPFVPAPEQPVPAPFVPQEALVPKPELPNLVPFESFPFFPNPHNNPVVPPTSLPADFIRLH